MAETLIRNSDVLSLELAVPQGHEHLRATLELADGGRLILQEATVANLVRAYVSVVTSPTRRAVRLVGRELAPADLKEGYAPWQLLEEA
jgi:hypothetical protein